MRYLGDVFLCTPLIHSLRAAYPQALLDVLVFANSAAILEGNPDIDSIIETRQGAGSIEAIQLILRIFRRYDVAFITQTGDRPLFYGVLAARIRVGAVPPVCSQGGWKRLFLRYWCEFDNLDTHTVRQHLKLAEAIGIDPIAELIPPRSLAPANEIQRALAQTRYAVLHMYPQWVYKRWTQTGWVEVGQYLERQHIRLVLSGSPAAEEIRYLQEIESHLPENTINLAGKLSIAELSDVIQGACLFIGPDTGITHLAAATGIPVIALFGPSNPVKWAPWPHGFDAHTNPFARIGSQNKDNIYLIQAEKHCVPCHLEGCERHRNSYSECLDTLPATRVIEKIASILALSDCSDIA